MALASDLAAAFSLIQQQQALEERKEERHHSLALNLLSQEMAQEERALDRENRKAEVTQGILLKEYYSKMEDVDKTERMFQKYNNISPNEITPGGAEIISIVDNQNNIDISALNDNLKSMNVYQNSLEEGLNNLRQQASTLKEMQVDFAGENRVLQRHEYEAFQEHALKSLEEGGLGWSNTAGADELFEKKDDTQRFVEALKITENMKGASTEGINQNYGILQGMLTLGENEKTKHLIERLTYEDANGKEIVPSEDAVKTLQLMAMQPVENFMTNLEALPASQGGDVIRAELLNNPNTELFYNNMIENNEAIKVLDQELAGINQPVEVDNYEVFVDQISGVTNQDALFQMYTQAVQGLPPEQHDAYFSAIEAASGGEDLGDAYMTSIGLNNIEDLNLKDVNPSFNDGFNLNPISLNPNEDLLAILNSEISSDSTAQVIEESRLYNQENKWNEYLELAKIDPLNFESSPVFKLLPSRARMVWWGLTKPMNSIERKMNELGESYRDDMLPPYTGKFMEEGRSERLEINRAKREEVVESLKLLEGNE